MSLLTSPVDVVIALLVTAAAGLAVAAYLVSPFQNRFPLPGGATRRDRERAVLGAALVVSRALGWRDNSQVAHDYGFDAMNRLPRRQQNLDAAVELLSILCDSLLDHVQPGYGDKAHQAFVQQVCADRRACEITLSSVGLAAGELQDRTRAVVEGLLLTGSALAG